MLLSQFFKNAPDIEIRQVSCDSRMPMEDCIFFCVKGIKDDGHNFVKEAISNGAKVIVYEKTIDTSQPCVYIRVSSVLDALNQVVAKFYDHPGKTMENFVIAGSYGRNSTAFILKDIISHYRSCGYIGSYGISYNDTNFLSNESTLTILENQRHLLKMKDNAVEACIFEASAIGLELKKLDGIYPKAFIYTNTSIAGSEYQRVDADYVEIFVRYINHINNPIDLIFNLDDKIYPRIVEVIDRNLISYSVENSKADFYASDIKVDTNGTSFNLNCFQAVYQVSTNLLGVQNVYNLLAAIATLVTRGYPINEVIGYCRQLVPPDGIMQSIDLGQNYKVIVDSCDSYDSILNALRYARGVVDVKHKIVVLFGLSAYSGFEKRNRFGQILNEYADIIVLTEDNPYEESVFKISEDIESGIDSKPSIVIENREDAIASAIELLNSGDMLLCLGKGNENFMYRSLGKETYAKDGELAKKYIKKRMEEENEISQVY